MAVAQENYNHFIVANSFVNITDPFHCDLGVILGYPPDRKVESLELQIGKGARIRSNTIIYSGSIIGMNLQTGHNVLIREQNEIGNNVSIWSNTVIDYSCKIGNGVKIHCNVYIPQFTTIEDNVFIAPGCTFANDFHPGCPDSMECLRGPILKQGARIGVNVTIIPGVTIGENSLIGSGSVITKNVAPNSVVYGNPGQVYKKISELKCKTGLRDYPYHSL